jgi:hypothetical protein
MFSCFGKFCKTKSLSPRRKTPSPKRSPARKVVGFTKTTGAYVYRAKNGKLETNNHREVKYVVNKKHSNYSGYYTLPEFKALAAAPSWNFSVKK